MQLYFLRHGIAVDHGAPGYEENDDAHPLTKEGIQLAKACARGLKTLVKPDIILTSPLPRACQTADIVSKRLKTPCIETPFLGLDFDLDRLHMALAPVMGGVPLDGQVIVVGHEPSFSQTIGLLVGPGLRVVLKKNGLARVDVDSPTPSVGQGVLRWLLTPSQLRRLA